MLYRRAFVFVREGNDAEARAAFDETIAFCDAHSGDEGSALMRAEAEKARNVLP